LNFASLSRISARQLGIGTVLEPDNEVVAVTHHNNFAACAPRSPLLGPQIEDVVKVDIRQQGRHCCSLRRAHFALRPLPVHHDARGQPFLDEPQDSSVRYSVLDKLRQPFVGDGIKVPTDIGIEHESHLSPCDGDRKRVQRIVLATPGSKSVGEAEEILLVDGVEHLHYCALENFVLKRGDAERPLPAVGLGDVRPASWLRPVRSTMQSGVQLSEILFELLAVLLPRHAVDTRCRVLFEGVERLAESVDVNVM
jgi:hypothetical protein